MRIFYLALLLYFFFPVSSIYAVGFRHARPTSSVVIYAEQNIESRFIEDVEPNDKLIVLDERKGWIKVQTKSDKIGWIPEKWVVVIDDSSSSKNKDVLSEEEKRLLWSSNFIFSEFSNKYKVVEKSGSMSLSVWHEVKYSAGNVQSAPITYDKIWVLEDTSFLTSQEISEFRGQLNIHHVYWKNNQIQAYVIKKYYPAYGEHKITDIFDRQYMLGRI